MRINNKEGLAEGLNEFCGFKNAYKKALPVHRRLKSA